MSAPVTSRWRALLGLLRPDAARWAGLGALLALGSMFGLVGPLIIRALLDRAEAGTTSGVLTRLAVAYLAVAVGAQLCSVVVAWFATITAWRTTNAIRMDMAAHVLGLDHEFHRRHTPGELIQRVDGDVTSVSDFLGRVIPRAAGAMLTVVGILGVLIVVDWRLAVGAAIYLAVTVRLIVVGRHRAVSESSDEMSSYARLYGGIEERLTAAEDIRANGAGAHAVWRFIEESAACVRSGLKRERAFLRLWWIVQSSVGAGSAVALAVSGLLVARGTISIGTAFLLFQYVQLISRPLEDFVHELETVQKANGAMVRVMDLMAIVTEIDDHGVVSPAAGSLAVEFRNVSFEYGDDELVLHNVTARIEPGRRVGVVGRTGSGKTTFSRLVLRLVEATNGTIELGGVPIADIPMAELRRRVALIPQEVELFSGTIRDNVTLFDDSPTDEAVVDALRRAGLAAVATGDIRRPLGPGGEGLSAGEAQLLSLARVWLRAPDIIVLDEPTARVDPETEARLDAAVNELTAGRTTLIIAHRLSTLRRADDIMVFDHGRIVEYDDRQRLADDQTSRFHRLLTLALDDSVDVDEFALDDSVDVDELDVDELDVGVSDVDDLIGVDPNGDDLNGDRAEPDAVGVAR